MVSLCVWHRCQNCNTIRAFAPVRNGGASKALSRPKDPLWDCSGARYWFSRLVSAAFQGFANLANPSNGVAAFPFSIVNPLCDAEHVVERRLVWLIGEISRLAAPLTSPRLQSVEPPQGDFMAAGEIKWKAIKHTENHHSRPSLFPGLSIAESSAVAEGLVKAETICEQRFAVSWF
jgi:hypothetical protein